MPRLSQFLKRCTALVPTPLLNIASPPISFIWSRAPAPTRAWAEKMYECVEGGVEGMVEGMASRREKYHGVRYTRNEWRRCENALETSGEDLKTTLETSGEDVKMHSKRVEKM